MIITNTPAVSAFPSIPSFKFQQSIPPWPSRIPCVRSSVKAIQRYLFTIYLFVPRVIRQIQDGPQSGWDHCWAPCKANISFQTNCPRWNYHNRSLFSIWEVDIDLLMMGLFNRDRIVVAALKAVAVMAWKRYVLPMRYIMTPLLTSHLLHILYIDLFLFSLNLIWLLFFLVIVLGPSSRSPFEPSCRIMTAKSRWSSSPSSGRQQNMNKINTYGAFAW